MAAAHGNFVALQQGFFNREIWLNKEGERGEEEEEEEEEGGSEAEGSDAEEEEVDNGSENAGSETAGSKKVNMIIHAYVNNLPNEFVNFMD